MDARHAPIVVVSVRYKELIDLVDNKISPPTAKLMIRPHDYDQANLLKLVSQGHYTAFSKVAGYTIAVNAKRKHPLANPVTKAKQSW